MTNWKHSYYGAAYTTRLKHLVTDLEKLVQRIEKLVEDDE